jgi:glyoxylase-like metal-dependent hydrolase (beta-lactamase superfamily II)
MDQPRTAAAAPGPGGRPPLSLSPWREVADRVYLAVAEPATVNLGLVVGSTGALLVDTGSTPEQGRQLRESVASVTGLPLQAVVVTHWHHDHAFGLGAFPDVPTLAHESVTARLAAPEALTEAAGLGISPADLRPPSRALAVAASVDLGDRRVEVAHLGPGHTEGDLLVVVPDADLLFVGDLLESAGAPWYGPDSRPHEWAATLDGVIGLMTAETRAVPGHGEPVDREFVFEARGRVAAVSGELTRLVDAGVAEADALAAGDWPYPAKHIAPGIAAGYAALAGRGVKGVRPTLPLAE